MSACQTVSVWQSKNVIVPVTRLITEAKEICENIDEWVEEQIEQPIEKQVTQQVEKCKDLPWYDPRGWFCWLVDIIVTVVVWALVTVGKWVTKLVCTIVTHVVGFVVELVVRVVCWLVSFVVCLFSEPGKALASFRDLWHILTDAAERVFDFADALLGFVEGALGDIREFLDSIAASFGWLGIVIGLVAGIIGLAQSIVGGARDALNGVRDVVIGLLSLSPCRMLRGITNLGVALVQTGWNMGFGLAPLAAVRIAGAAVGGVIDAVQAKQVEDMIRERIKGMGWTEERTQKALVAVRLGRPTMGLPFAIDARRLFLNSENPRFNPRIAHLAGTIDLYRLAGYMADCADTLESPAGEVVYTGTRLRVSYADLATYLANGPGSTAPFEVYGFTAALARSHVAIGKRKARALGIRPNFAMGKVEATLPEHIPLNVSEADPPGGTVQEDLFGSAFGRDSAGTNLETVPAVAVFRYTKPSGSELFGLTSWFRPPNDLLRSGVTWRARTPDLLFRWVLVHELGHYWGLNHSARDGGTRPARHIMFKPSTGAFQPGGDLAEYLLFSGEPSFPLDDARTSWEWMTGPGVAPLLFPV